MNKKVPWVGLEPTKVLEVQIIGLAVRIRAQDLNFQEDQIEFTIGS